MEMNKKKDTEKRKNVKRKKSASPAHSLESLAVPVYTYTLYFKCLFLQRRQDKTLFYRINDRNFIKTQLGEEKK